MNDSTGIQLDSVVVSIESNAIEAVDSLDKLSASLQTLKSALSGRTDPITKLANGMEALKNATNGIEAVPGKLKGIGRIAKSIEPLTKIGSTKRLTELGDNLQKLSTSLAQITPETLENVGRVSTELASKLKPLSTELKNIAEGYHAISQLAKNYNVSIKDMSKSQGGLKNSLSSTGKAFSTLTNVVKKSVSVTQGLISGGAKITKFLSKPITKLTSKIKQMGFALLSVRSAFTFVRKAINEYMQMDTQLQSSIQNTWRAMGAQLAPVVEYVTNLFHQFVRVIYSMVLALTGVDLIARANDKAMKSWGASSKKTLGNLQKFDDLNVVDFGKSSGEDNKLIDMETIDLSPIQKILDWAKKLKQTIQDALDTGDWKKVGAVFSKGINGAMTTLLDNFDTLQSKISNLQKSISDTVNGLIGELNGEDLGASITKVFTTIKNFVPNIISGIEWDVFGQKLMDTIRGLDAGAIVDSLFALAVELSKALGGIVKEIEWDVVGQKLGDAFKSVLKNLNTILANIPFNEILTGLWTAIINMDWKSIGWEILKLLGNVFSSITEIFAGILGIDTSSWLEFSKILDGILITIGIIVGVWLAKLMKNAGKNKNPAEGLNKMGEGLGNLFNKLGNAAQYIAILGGIALVISQITGLVKAFGESGVSAGDAAHLIVVAFGAIAGAFALLALAVKMIDLTQAASIALVLASMALVLSQVTGLMTAFGESGLKLGETLGLLGGVLGIVVVAMGLMAAVAVLLGSNPLYLIAFAAIALAIMGVLTVIAATLPTILEACGKFIETIAPPLTKILDTIFSSIERIVTIIGVTLVATILSTAVVFNTVFNGISKLVRTIGDVIVDIMNTAGDLIDKVLKSILNFIRELGPAINTFVDNAIKAITKLINFMVSGIEYLINTLVIGSLNGLIKGINKLIPGDSLDINTVKGVSIPRFAPKLETGTNEIPYEGLYHLHPGEAVVPKKYNPALGGGSNEDTNQKLDTLIAIMNNMNFTNVVNIGNKTIYKQQQQYNRSQNDKYGTTVNI